MLAQLLILCLIAISVGLNTTGQTLLKLGAGQNSVNLYLLGGLGVYAISAVFYILVLGKLNLSIAYPVVIGLTIIATTIVGAFWFKETVSTVGWIGIGLMLGGISAIAVGKIL